MLSKSKNREGARTQVGCSVNAALVQANWLIGHRIVEAQQAGKVRAVEATE
jgi:hypothetical protein